MHPTAQRDYHIVVLQTISVPACGHERVSVCSASNALRCIHKHVVNVIVDGIQVFHDSVILLAARYTSWKHYYAHR